MSGSSPSTSREDDHVGIKSTSWPEILKVRKIWRFGKVSGVAQSSSALLGGQLAQESRQVVVLIAKLSLRRHSSSGRQNLADIFPSDLDRSPYKILKSSVFPPPHP